jgi:hypothetical protein
MYLNVHLDVTLALLIGLSLGWIIGRAGRARK